MQQPNAACTRHRLNADLNCPCATCIWFSASCYYTCAQDGLDTVQLALVVFFLPSTSENTVHNLLQLVLVVLFLGVLVHLLMCTQTNRHAHLTTCTMWWCWWL